MFKVSSAEIRDRIKYNVKQDFPVEGVKFIDFMPTFSDISLMNDILDYIAQSVSDLNIDYVVMPESRGYLLGVLLASKLKANIVPVRKHGKLPEDFIQASYEYQTEYSKETLDIPKIDIKDKNCFFIDDVYALGGTYYACKRLVEMSGGKLLGGACLYNVGLNENPELFCFMDSEDIK